MKKIFLLNSLLLLTAVNLYSQSGDSCVEAIEITAGTYTVMELTETLLKQIALNMMLQMES